MIWKGKDLMAPQHYIDAMYEISDADEAQRFLDAWEQESPTARRDAGYLTGYAANDRGIALRALFQVEHPIMGDLVPERAGRHLSFDELLNLGMQFAQYHYVEHMRFIRDLRRERAKVTDHRGYPFRPETVRIRREWIDLIDYAYRKGEFDATKAESDRWAASEDGQSTFRELTKEPVQRAAEREKVGRNDPCPCGSGRKYKRCHGE